MINISNISKHYDDDIVFKDLNIRINANLTKISGDNGTGKSTLLRIIAGLEEYSGEIIINNKKCKKDFLQRNIILVDQNIYLLENESVYKNIFSLNLKRNILEELEFFGINEILNQKVYTLSGGQKKKLSLFIAFALKPKILLLDEYSNYLEKDFIILLNDYIKKYTDNNIVIYVDHTQNIGGDIINLDDLESNSSIMDNDLSKNTNLNNLKFKISRLYFFKQYSFQSIVGLAILLVLSILILFSFSLSRVSKSSVMYDFYNQNGLNYQQISNTADLSNIESDLYYVKYSSSQDKMNYGYNSITYYKNINFELENESITNTKNYKEAYVFSYMRELLGTIIKVNEEEYLVSGIIVYPCEVTSSEDSRLFNTVFINEDINDFEFMTSFLSSKDLKRLFDSESIVINSKYLFSIEENFNQQLYQKMGIVASVLLIILTIVFFVLEKKKNKHIVLFLNQYSCSSSELLVTRIISIIPKCVILGFFGYLFAHLIIKKYQSVLVAPFSISIGVNLNVFIILILTIFLLMIMCCFLKYKKRD